VIERRRGLSRGIVLVVLALLAAWIAATLRSSRTSPSRPAVASAADSAFADSVLIAAEPAGPDVTVTRSDLAAPERDPARTAQLLSTRSAGTYLGEMLAAHDSMNFRWPDRSHAPMRVWVQWSSLPGFDPYWPALVRDAFTAWADAGVPIFFSFTPDSARAEIHVTWVDRFESRMTGRTRWAHDQNGWIVGGNLQLALHQFDGPRLDTDAVRAIARHEVGHLIGLDHTEDESNIMSARVRVTDMSEADRATARLVYQLPPGSLKARE
jgi:Matrixin